jgi:hypothetical protein
MDYMDSPFIIIVITIAVLIIAGVIVAVAAWRKRRELNEQQTDYRAFFIMGVVMLPLGIAGMIVAIATDISFVVAMPLIAIGIVYMSLGLANRAGWRR